MIEPFRTNLASVPHVGGLREEEGWVDMRVQFLIDGATSGSAAFLLGWTIMAPGARHEKHAHDHADEFFIVLEGAGEVYTDKENQPAAEGDVIFTPRGHWHGFNNTGEVDVTLVWGWSGAGSLEQAGYRLA